ncbi:MAG: hypothetical protein ACKOOL_11250 [Novosphingobium sp.]
MSKQLALAVSFSVLATVALVVFGVAPAMHLSGSLAAPGGISVEASPLPGLTQILPTRF